MIRTRLRVTQHPNYQLGMVKLIQIKNHKTFIQRRQPKDGRKNETITHTTTRHENPTLTQASRIFCHHFKQ